VSTLKNYGWVIEETIPLKAKQCRQRPDVQANSKWYIFYLYSLEQIVNFFTLAMQNTMTIRNASAATQTVSAGKPTMPLGRQPIIERKFSDPSSSPKGERYPIPSFFEYRTRPKNDDLL